MRAADGAVTAVRVGELTVTVGRRTIVGPVSFGLPTGGVLGLRGPSGSGKSTVLRALVGLLPPELEARGCVQVLGIDVVPPGRADLPALRSSAVLVGQAPVIFPTSILANAAFGARHLVRASRRAMRARCQRALEEAGLWDEVSDRLDAPARHLSIGQRQRLCLARALALDPSLLLLDEPTSALDAAATATVEAALSSLRGRRTVLMVSHDGPQLGRLCDEVVTLPDPFRAVGEPAPVPG